MIRDYLEEFAYYFALFFALFLLFVGFKPLFKTAIVMLPMPTGAKEAVAA